MNWARSAILNSSRDHCLYVPCRGRWDGPVISTFIRAKWRCSRLPDNALPSSVILKPAVLVRFRGGNRTRDFSLGSPNFTLSHPFTSIPGASAKRNTNTFLPKGIKNKKIYIPVFILNVQHLLIDFLHWHLPTEHCGHCEVSPMSRITCRHHVLVVEHLLS